MTLRYAFGILYATKYFYDLHLNFFSSSFIHLNEINKGEIERTNCVFLLF